MFTKDQFWRPVPRWDMERARRFMREHRAEEYNLIDVRQPEEFAEGHLPGARLIPLDRIPGRLSEIDRGKPSLLYCRTGGRAANAAALLHQAGVTDAHAIGGIAQWDGLVATGMPIAGMAYRDPARSPEEYVAVAWVLEEGARLFYLDAADLVPGLELMLEGLARAEEQHRDELARRYRELTGREPALPGVDPGGLMEGGIRRDQALSWARAARPADVLELCAVMEANAHDRYIHLGRSLGGPVGEIFAELAEAEKVHQDQLMAAFNERR